MNIYHLKYFIDAARLQSISKSAEENHISHSAVSQGIKSLENFLDVKLLVHSKRRFQLTPEGEVFQNEGAEILASLNAAKENIRLRQKEVSGDLIIWAPQSLIVDSLYQALAIYQKKYPKVNIAIKPGSAERVRGAISGSEAHLGILIDDGYLDVFESEIIKKGQFILVSKMKGDDCKEAPTIVTSRNKIEVRHLFKKFKTKYKKDMQVSMEVMSWSVIKNLVLKKFGIGYLPDYCVSHELETEKLYQISSPGSAFQYEIKAIWQKNKQIHPNAKLFLDLLKK